MALRKTTDAASKLADSIHGAAQENIPAGNIRDQVRGRTLPPATPSSKGAVTLSDDTPQPLGTADPGTGSPVSRADHVHAHGNLAGGSLHTTATGSVAGFQSAADKAKEDLYPAVSGLTPGNVLTALTSATVGFATPTGGSIPAGSVGDILYFDNTGALVLLPMAGVPLGSALYATSVGPDQLPAWDIQPPQGGASGDLGNSYPDPIVTGFYGRPIDSGTPTTGDAFVWDGSAYALTQTVSSVNVTQPAAGITATGGPITSSGAITLALANDLAALEGLSSTGLAARTGTDTWAQRSIVGTANRISITNGNGVSGNPTLDIDAAYVGQTSIITLGTIGTGTWQGAKVGLTYGGTNADLSATGGANQFLKQSSVGAAITVGALVAGDIPDLSATYQPLDADLTAIAGFSGTGLAARTAANTWAQRSIVGTTNRLSVTNGSGAGGNPTLDIDSAYVGQTSITTLGTIGTGTWNATKIGLAFGGTNADLSATGGTNQIVRQNSAGGVFTVSVLASDDIPTTLLGARFARLNSTNDNDITIPLTLAHTNSFLLTGNVGFGVGLKLTLDSSTTVNQDAAQLTALWTTATHASRTAALTVQTVNNGGSLAETARFTGPGALWIGRTSGGLTGAGDLDVAGNVAIGGTFTLPTKSANTVFAGPTTGGAATPAFRALVAADLPAVSLTAGVSGILPAGNGGTGINNAGKLTLATDAAITGGGTLALGGFTLTVPATGTAALISSGTYSPTYLGSSTAGSTTYTLQQGAWVKKGNEITVIGTLVWTAASGTGNANISLPFAAANVSNQFVTGSVRVDGVTFAAGAPEMIISPNTSFFTLVSPTTNATPTTVVMEAAGNIVFTITYFF